MTKREKAALREIGGLFMIARINPIPEKREKFYERVHSCLIALYCSEPMGRVEDKIGYAKELLGPHVSHLDDYLCHKRSQLLDGNPE